MSIEKYHNIESSIFTIRETQVMLDSELAFLYGTETKFINRAVKRNPLRFPDSFVFQLAKEEWNHLKYQSGTSSNHGGRRTMPYVFTPLPHACAVGNCIMWYSDHQAPSACMN